MDQQGAEALLQPSQQAHLLGCRPSNQCSTLWHLHMLLGSDSWLHKKMSQSCATTNQQCHKHSHRVPDALGICIRKHLGTGGNVSKKNHKSQSWSKVHWNWKAYSSFWILKLLLRLFKVDSSRALKSWVLCLSKPVEKTLAFPSSPSISVPGRGLHGSENSRPQLFPIFIQFNRWNVFVTLRSFNASNWQCKDVSQCPIRLERHNAVFKTARTSATGLPTEATCPTKRWTVAVSLEGPFRSWQSTVSQRPSWIFERNHTFSSPFSYIMDPSTQEKGEQFQLISIRFSLVWVASKSKKNWTQLNLKMLETPGRCPLCFLHSQPSEASKWTETVSVVFSILFASYVWS